MRKGTITACLVFQGEATIEIVGEDQHLYIYLVSKGEKVLPLGTRVVFDVVPEDRQPVQYSSYSGVLTPAPVDRRILSAINLKAA